MASKRKYPAEDTQDSCTGYMHEISPIKRSKANNPYFEGTIQVADRQYQRLVCFDTTKHATLQGAATAKTPLKLTNIKQSPSRADATKSDVVVNQSSSLEMKMRKLDFDYLATKKATTGKTRTSIKTIIDQIPEYNKVAILAKVAKVAETTQQDVRGQSLGKQDIIMADDTAYITMTLWDKLTDKMIPDHIYMITNLTTRNFNNTKTLTTTLSTTIEEVTEDLPNIVEVDIDTANITNTVVGEVSQVIITPSKTCMACKKKVGEQMDLNTTSTFFRCCFCNMKQKMSSMKSSMSGTINVTSATETKTVKLAIYNSVLTTFLTTMDKPDLLSNANLLEEYLLELPTISVTYGPDNVVQKLQT